MGEAPTSSTPDVTLREATERDLDLLFAHWTDPEARRMAAFMPPDAHERSAFDERWRRFAESDAIAARVIEAGGEVVGSIGSWENEGIREVTYWLGREHWGKGLATRALSVFLRDVERTRPLQAATAHDNLGSQRVLEKCGFRRVGRGRGYSHVRGEDVDEIVFCLDS